MLAFAGLLVGGLVLLPHRDSQAQESQNGALIRAVLATPVTLQALSFDPGPPIAEDGLKTDDDFLAVLERTNPGWTFELLGQTMGQGPDRPGDAEAPLFSGHAEILQATQSSDGEMDATLKLKAISRHPAAQGQGITSDHFVTRLPLDQAHLIASMEKKGNPSQVLVFATLLSPSGVAQASSRSLAALDPQTIRSQDRKIGGLSLSAGQKGAQRSVASPKTLTPQQDRLAKGGAG
jgi:hypothetical protein